jgi:hypothetical protein
MVDEAQVGIGEFEMDEMSLSNVDEALRSLRTIFAPDGIAQQKGAHRFRAYTELRL